ncbi:hypothetical protein KIL84_009121 [Mauremys mutica]|uniref:Uncharacterized protein n=1 Tax=Mauremys mutica TaxID=74926 RepID=A0A9D4B4U7_9SAUR|nr:hypothetical protein KIL84_009121 [Mauremys mutica]
MGSDISSCIVVSLDGLRDCMQKTLSLPVNGLMPLESVMLQGRRWFTYRELNREKEVILQWWGGHISTQVGAVKSKFKDNGHLSSLLYDNILFLRKYNMNI